MSRWISRVDEVADRWQRRNTGPWQTKHRHLGPVVFEHRFRYRPRIEFVRLWIASQHVWHELRPGLRRLAKFIYR